MLLLTFHLGEDRYAIDAAAIVGVLPLMPLKEVPQAPAAIAGILSYLGNLVPVVDLCAATMGRISRNWMSTRVVLTHYQTPSGEQRQLGIIAEKATETVRLPESAFNEPVVSVESTRYLGRIAHDHRGLLQLIQIEQLLPEEVRRSLFPR